MSKWIVLINLLLVRPTFGQSIFTQSDVSDLHAQKNQIALSRFQTDLCKVELKMNSIPTTCYALDKQNWKKYDELCIAASKSAEITIEELMRAVDRPRVSKVCEAHVKDRIAIRLYKQGSTIQ